MLKPLPWQLDPKEPIEGNGFLPQTKIWIREAEKCWTAPRDIEMESKISGLREE